nr:MAG TPA: hypothetical protein [Bacteriophage sp.]DAX88305.1 MAG TPA: hypothetical protein [Caudoviricetes sp.]
MCTCTIEELNFIKQSVLEKYRKLMQGIYRIRRENEKS